MTVGTCMFTNCVSQISKEACIESAMVYNRCTCAYIAEVSKEGSK